MSPLSTGLLFRGYQNPPPPAPPAPSGGGSGTGTWPSPQPGAVLASGTSTPISSWIKVDTTNLWTAHGGTVTGSGTLKVSNAANGNTPTGVDTQWGFTQPTSGSPVVYYLMPVGTHQLILTDGTNQYTWTFDVAWVGYPWKARSDSYGTGTGPSDPNAGNNVKWFGGAHPLAVGDVYPNSGNSYGDGAAYQNVAALNNGYSMIPDATNGLTGTTSCTFAVVPGDEPYQVGASDKDTRAEISIIEGYATGSNALSAPNVPTGKGIDPLGNIDLRARWLRHDFLFPATWTAPGGTLIENANNSGWTTDLARRGLNGYPSTTNPGIASSTWAPTATQMQNAVKQLSNVFETGGPAVFVIGQGLAGGSYGALRCFIQTTSLGIGLQLGTFAGFNIAMDARYCLMVEYQPGLYATSNGSPWIANTATDANIGQTTKYTVSISGTAVTWLSGGKFPYSASTAANQQTMVGDTFGLPGVAGLFRVAAVNSATSLTLTTAPGNTASTTMYQLPFYPYGSPPGAPGGGYVRIWQIPGTWDQVKKAWTSTGLPVCLTNGSSNAVAGAALMDASGNITGGDAGKIFGPTIKCNGGYLATGPGGSTGTVIPQTWNTFPFTITVTNVVAGTGFRPSGGMILIDNELFTFSSQSGSGLTRTLTISARAQYGTTAANHTGGEVAVNQAGGSAVPVGALCSGLIDINEASPGINQGVNLATPFVVREWPMVIGPTAASVIATPAA